MSPFLDHHRAGLAVFRNKFSVATRRIRTLFWISCRKCAKPVPAIGQVGTITCNFGSITNTAVASSPNFDPKPGNKSARVTTQIFGNKKTVPMVVYAIVYDGLEEKDLALEALRKAYENRETNLVFLRSWPHFDFIRDDPRFQEIERLVGLRT